MDQAPASGTIAITTESREISDLRPHPRNYRRHPEH